MHDEEVVYLYSCSMVYFLYCQCSILTKLLGHGIDSRENVLRLPAEARDFLLRKDPRKRPASYPVGTGASTSGGNAAEK
jgi:hypothetical protein